MTLSWGLLSKYRNQIYGLSIIWIVIYHIYEFCIHKMNFSWISTLVFYNGYIGVDVFLFLSGISLYFSLAKKNLKRKVIFDFYKKRFCKILKVYIFFCIPFLVCRDLLVGNDSVRFLKQVFFLDDHVSSFWFIAIIMLCYLIYPMLFYIIKNSKLYIIKIIILLYIVFLVIMNHYAHEYYMMYEVLLSRIPVFLLGTLYAEKVYNDCRIKLSEISTYILMIFLRGPAVFALSMFQPLNEITVIVDRLFLGLMGVGVVFIFLIFTQIFEGSIVDRIVSFLGIFTLEIYVFHIAYRAVLLGMCHFPLDRYRQIILFAVVFILGSFLGGYILSLIMGLIKLPKQLK